jgi:predicted metal-dependent phosphoesterase TrpH
LDCNQPPGIDLHIHSTASDGTDTPSEIIDHAHRLGLAAVSITDHDTISGCREVLQRTLPRGLAFVTGVEISVAPPAFFPVSGSLHMLGYGVSPDNAVLAAMLEKLQDSRLNRNPRIIERLNALGLAITMDDVVHESARPNQMGRPHIARTLVRKGFVDDFDAAFDTYLGSGRPAYIDKYRAPFAEAVAAVTSAGGIAVIAHPGIYQTGEDAMTDATMAEFKNAGVSGIEVYYPEHTAAQTARYETLADRNGLLKTGGTDFHGGLKPEIALGAGYGDFHVPVDLFEQLLAALGR